ncbi:MAG: hypothetical protein RRA51_06955, partial [Armatimonadota bacterium]|nr:hypothetical protein [Armatimonadota bacterium]
WFWLERSSSRWRCCGCIMSILRAWEQGGYEVSIGQWALCGQGSGEAIVSMAKSLLAIAASQEFLRTCKE